MEVYDGCPFCHEISGDIFRSHYYKHIYPSTRIADRKIIETEHFVLIPAIGSFTEGYMLAVSKKHTYSLLSSPKQMLDDLIKVNNVIASYFRHRYDSDCIYFEHGATSSDNGGTSVVHTHIHFIPYPNNCPRPVIPFQPTAESESLFDIMQAHKENTSYLLFKDSDSLISYYNEGLFPSQILRKVVAQELGYSTKWDWKENFCEENMMKTLYDAKKYFLEKLND